MRRLRQEGLAASVLVALAGAVAALGLSGCGSTSPRRLDAAEASSLQTLLATAKWRADHGQSAGAVEALSRVQARLRQLASAGKLASDDAKALRSEASQALATATSELRQARARAAAASPPSTPELKAPAPQKAKERPAAAPKHRHGKGKEHGKGGGEGGG